MKPTTRIIRRLGLGTIFGLSLITSAHAQLQFTDAKVTQEGAVKLSWQSESNAVYQVEYADQLLDVSLGGPAWQTLYDEYPSHGTNTFIADAGNYDITPAIPHPKLSPMRFYRVMLTEANTASSNPTVAITSPTNGATLSGDITVRVFSSSSDILSELKLYVDGELQWSSADETNFLINTCEWLNGPHVLFATAKSQSGLEGAANGGVITYGRSVSSYVNVTFNNLITRFDLSQPFFEPALGQTQQVTATFAANVNWTLRIQDASSNTVRTATGSGGTMQFNWDGNGNGGVAIPDGVYSYLLTVQTNGQPLVSQEPSGGDDSGSLPLPSISSSLSASASTVAGWYPTSALEARGAGWDFYYSQPPPMPPVKTNGVWVPWEEVFGLEPLLQVAVPTQSARSGGLGTASATTSADVGLQTDATTQDYSGPASQSTRAPERKPRTGVKGEVGTFGVLYLTYGTNGFSSNHPRTGWPYPLPTYVAIDGQTRTAQTVDRRVSEYKKMANDFAEVMQRGAWKQAFLKGDGQWGANDITKTWLGGNSIFNSCSLGLLMTHGSFGNTGPTGTADDGVSYTYIWLGGGSYVRLSDMDFGSPGVNGLRWMTIMACSILAPYNYGSMNDAGLIPVNNDLHLLLGPSTTAYASPELGKAYANNLVVNKKTVVDSFVQAGTTAAAFDPYSIANVIKFAAVGTQSCFSDTLSTYNDPDGNGLVYQEFTVWTPQ
jgi:hypothetical protein